jgi:hypothetical protein
MINIAYFATIFSRNSVVSAGSFVPGVAYQITEVGTTSFTSIGSSQNTVGTVFIATQQGQGSGKAVPHLSIRRFQNFFYSEESSVIRGSSPVPSAQPSFLYAPFQVEGATAQLNGENETLQVLFPFSAFAVKLVEEGNGNRLSYLKLDTVWYESNSSGSSFSDYQEMFGHSEVYIGVGASFSETTVELRFKSAMDSVNANFPAQSFTRENAGILPLSADISLR